MGTAPARLSKAIAAHGTTFNDLVTRSRERLALRYLADTDFPLTDIALRLGYSELSAFSRAFLKWTGISPRHYRPQLQHRAGGGGLH